MFVHVLLVPGAVEGAQLVAAATHLQLVLLHGSLAQHQWLCKQRPRKSIFALSGVVCSPAMSQGNPLALTVEDVT